jgi:hypothetical protein
MRDCKGQTAHGKRNILKSKSGKGLSNSARSLQGFEEENCFSQEYDRINLIEENSGRSHFFQSCKSCLFQTPRTELIRRNVDRAPMLNCRMQWHRRQFPDELAVANEFERSAPAPDTNTEDSNGSRARRLSAGFFFHSSKSV